MPSRVVVAFDAYGTLLSTESIAKQLAEHFGQDRAQNIAATWRKYQLEYTWRLNSMDQYEPFSAITQRSLKHALKESNVSLAQNDVEALMKAYDSLSIFLDVAPCLTSLKSQASVTAVVFSNGTQAMVSNSINHSPDLAPHASVFSDIVVVEPVKKYKPAPEVYMHLAEKVGKKPTEMDDLWLVSGNPFDVVGARAVGMKAAWVDRAGNGWQDALVAGQAGEPTVVLKSLEDLPAILEKRASA
ncbi:haloacid type ii [Diplodia corticola]|uniref:Haloacid type ii n=1 Tax=Diplodia corticola TaxID=236234 RepID=A0A1J9R378_9PEZI|nr:haloacid type ii [Diplodia corticola]OJD34682.1 haloacid type ii [Diplodia corticola]